MAIAFVGQAQNERIGSPGTSVVVTRTVAAGNALVMIVSLSSTTVSVSSISGGGTWVLGKSMTSPSTLAAEAHRVEIWYCLNATAVTSVTVTVSATVWFGATLAEFSGVATASALVGSASPAGTPVASIMDSGTLTPTQEVVLVGAIGHGYSPSVKRSGDGFTALTSPETQSGYGRAAYKLASSGAQSALWDVDPNFARQLEWAGAIIALKSAAAPAASTISRLQTLVSAAEVSAIDHTLAVPAGTSAGSCLTLCATVISGSYEIGSVTDSSGNVWTKVVGPIYNQVGPGFENVSIWICENAASLAAGGSIASHLVGVGGGAGAARIVRFCFRELAGVALSAAKDVAGSDSPTAPASPARSGSATPTALDSIALAVMALEASTLGAVVGGFTDDQNIDSGGRNARSAIKIQNSAVAAQATWTMTPVEDYAGAIVILKANAAAPPPTGTSVTFSRDATRSKFGSSSLKAVNALAAGSDHYGWQSCDVTPSTAYTVTAWLDASGFTGAALSNRGLYVEQRDVSGTVLATSQTNLTAVTSAFPDGGVWHELNLTTQATCVTLRVRLYSPTGSVWWDGVQVEASPVPTPVVTTPSGQTASRAAPRPQAPASLLSAQQGWWAVRFRPGFSTAQESGQIINMLARWEDTTATPTHYQALAYWESDNTLKLGRRAGGTEVFASTAATLVRGTTITVIGAWTATAAHKISLNGAAFVSAASALQPIGLASLWDIGSTGGYKDFADGDVLWFAAGTGTLTDANAATIHGFGDADPALASLPGTPSMLWRAITAAYDTPTAAPSNTVAPVASGSAVVGQTLATTNGTWQGATSYAYQWARDTGTGFVNISGATSASYLLVSGDLNARVRAGVIATSAGGSATAYSNQLGPVTAATSAPVNTVLPTISGSALVGSTLTASSGTWTGTPTPTYAYQWYRSTTAILNATAASYVPTSADVGFALYVVVTASNSAGTATAQSASTALVAYSQANAPVNTSLPAISGTTKVTQVLSVTTGNWNNNPTAYSYAWKRSGSAIAGATTSTYALVAADQGTTITCTVTASNSSGSASATSAGVGPIAAAPGTPTGIPVLTTAPVVTGSPVAVGATLICSSGVWTQSPTSFTYSWQRNGVDISDFDPFHLLTSADIGATLRCRVTAVNSFGSSAVATSNSVGPVTIGAVSHISPPWPNFQFEIDYTNDPLSIPYATAIRQSGPYSWYRFKEGALAGSPAYDSSGYGRNGLYTGVNGSSGSSPITGETGTNAVGFLNPTPGSGYPYGAGMYGYGPAAPAGFTFECWYWPQGYPYSVPWTMFCDGNEPDPTKKVKPYAVLSGATIYFYNPGGVNPLGGGSGCTAAPLTANTWTHVAFVITGNPGYLQIYLNGVAVGQTNAAETNNIGGFSGIYKPTDDYLNYQWQGFLAEMCTYDRALAQVEVVDHFAATAIAVRGADVWTSETSSIRSVSFSRGRQQELEQVETSQLSAQVRDKDRHLENAVNPAVKPVRSIRFRGTIGPTSYDIWRGFTQGFPFTVPAYNRRVVSLSAYDLMGAISRWSIYGNGPQEPTSQRVHRVLDKVGWSQNLRRVDAGAETVVATQFTGESAYEHLQLVATSEAGLFYVDGAGVAVFESKTHRSTDVRSLNTQAVFGDAGDDSGELIYSDPQFSDGYDRIINEAQVSFPAIPYLGSSQVAGDPASRNQYGHIATSRSTLLADPSAAYQQALAIVNAHKQPVRYVKSLTIDPRKTAVLWQAALNLRISDRVLVRRRPYSGGAWIELYCFIENVSFSLDVDAHTASVTYQFSPA